MTTAATAASPMREQRAEHELEARGVGGLDRGGVGERGAPAAPAGSGSRSRGSSSAESSAVGRSAPARAVRARAGTSDCGVDLGLGAGGVGRALARIGAAGERGLARQPAGVLAGVVALAHSRGQIVSSVTSIGGASRLGGVEHLDDLVAVELPALDERLGDPQHLLAVVAHQADGGQVGLAEDLRGGALLGRVAEDRRDRVALLAGAARPVHDLQADPLEALHDSPARPPAPPRPRAAASR